MKGKVKFYNRSKDFGFIASEDSQEYYFNAASMKVAQDNDAVEFETMKTARGEVAKQVVLSGTAQATAATTGGCPVKKRPICFIVTAVIVIAAFLLGHYI